MILRISGASTDAVDWNFPKSTLLAISRPGELGICHSTRREIQAAVVFSWSELFPSASAEIERWTCSGTCDNWKSRLQIVMFSNLVCFRRSWKGSWKGHSWYSAAGSEIYEVSVEYASVALSAVKQGCFSIRFSGLGSLLLLSPFCCTSCASLLGWGWACEKVKLFDQAREADLHLHQQSSFLWCPTMSHGRMNQQ